MRMLMSSLAARRLLLFALLVSAAANAWAGIYKWVDANGRVQFSDRPPVQGGAEEVQLREINTFEGVSVEDLPAAVSKSQRAGKAKKVVMYSAAWCGVCTQARRFFKAEGIPFRERDVDKSPAAKREWERMNARGVPVILVGGKRMSGFSEQRFMELYEN